MSSNRLLLNADKTQFIWLEQGDNWAKFSVRLRQSLGSIFDESGEGCNLVTSASTFPETSLVWTD